jgi:hypothetical protein
VSPLRQLKRATLVWGGPQVACVGAEVYWRRRIPQRRQNLSLTAAWVPQLWQYTGEASISRSPAFPPPRRRARGRFSEGP